MTRMTESQPDLLEKFNKRFRAKKHLNLGVSALLLLLGVSSFLFGLALEPSVTVLRFMTVDGTLFTTAGALAYIIINLVESRRTTELTSIGCCGGDGDFDSCANQSPAIQQRVHPDV